MIDSDDSIGTTASTGTTGPATTEDSALQQGISDPLPKPVLFWVWIGLGCAGFVILIIGVICIVHIRKRNSKKEFDLQDAMETPLAVKPLTSTNYQALDNVSMIPYEQVKVLHEIGTGYFSTAYKATYKSRNVCIKIFNTDTLDTTNIFQEFAITQ